MSVDNDVAMRRRLANQRLAGPRAKSPAELIRWLGALQAQDYPAASWAIGLRLADSGVADVEAAVTARAIVRTWPMRGTLHFVPAGDVRWMLSLLAPRVIEGSARRYRELDLEESDFSRASSILVRAMEGGRALTRAEAYAELDRRGISPAGQRGIHILGNLAQRGVLCCGASRGRERTFVLLDEWAPTASQLSRDEALATLAERYFASHGPATLRDFSWWSGLLARDARRAVEIAGTRLRAEGDGSATMFSAEDRPRVRSGSAPAMLLPPWDEYIVAYQDRSHALGKLDPSRAAASGLVGRPLVVIDGRVRGAWRRDLGAKTVRVHLDPWTPLATSERRAVEQAASRYADFLGRELELRGLPAATKASQAKRQRR